MEKQQSTFIALLDLLKVKYTNDFSNRYFNEHPHKYNLFGLSKMLSDYGVENVATRITDKEKDIATIETPFIAHFGGDFVVVDKIDQPLNPLKGTSVHYFWNGQKIVLPVSQFIEAWTGIVLLAESSEQSIEPNYKEHKKRDRLNFLKKAALFSTCCLLLIFAYIHQSLQLSLTHLFSYTILLSLNLIGIYISYLLLLKQMRVQSQYADKICSLFKQNDCNHVLESKAAKLWGMFGWSEIGLGYFLTNFLVLLLFPTWITYIALINIITLPYSFWSVWYQRTKAKQWCVLCLIVQVLLWAIFIANYLFGYIQIPAFSYSIIQLFSFYAASVLVINALVPKLNAERLVPILRQAINGIKADEDVFKALLKQQPFYKTSDSDSIIRFGNPDSSLRLTILSNPYCNPCSRMHKRIERLLQKMNNNIAVQYILSSFDESLESTNKYLIAACLQSRCHCGLDSQSHGQIFTDWFEKGKALRDDYFKDKNLDMDNPEIETEFQKHEAWRKKTQLRATPTVLVNGYQLPGNYKIEDLRYFTEFNIEM